MRQPMDFTTALDPAEDFEAWHKAGESRGYYATPSTSAKLWAGRSEKDLIEAATPSLELFFEVKTERWGTCFPFSQVPTRRIRVDAICIPRTGVDWALGPFAIEFKKPDRPDNVKLGDHIKQAIDYKATYFDGLGFMPVFLCPGIQGYKEHDGLWASTGGVPYDLSHYESARRVLGGLGLGEMFVGIDGRVSMYLSASSLIYDNQITVSARKQRKAGRGVGASSV